MNDNVYSFHGRLREITQMMWVASNTVCLSNAELGCLGLAEFAEEAALRSELWTCVGRDTDHDWGGRKKHCGGSAC